MQTVEDLLGEVRQVLSTYPEHHDKGPEGSRSISLTEFLAEADALLYAERLI